MEKGTRQTAFAALGAVVGSGFASGKEIASFFSRYGRWSWLGIAAAAAVVLMITLRVLKNPGTGGMPERWEGKWQGVLWRCMFGLLMLTTGGAMLAGGGEIAALMLPVQNAYVLGVAVTGTLTLMLAWQGEKSSAVISRILVILLMAMAGAGFFLPVRQGAALYVDAPCRSVLQGACYAGFNMALAVPGLAAAAEKMSRKMCVHCAMLTAGLLGVLLLGANALLLRHPTLQGEAMPFVILISGYGKTGYVLGGACMYLAVQTTACASLRGVWSFLQERSRWRFVPAAGMLLCAFFGFSGLVERVYPVLGMVCLVLMAGAFCTKNEKNA